GGAGTALERSPGSRAVKTLTLRRCMQTLAEKMREDLEAANDDVRASGLPVNSDKPWRSRGKLVA
ncbi:MAG: hypothetical protein QF412_04760, partial [Planctomycetota bacterium]|nr:hypothetical protein [Planctomycetota bacterium]